MNFLESVQNLVDGRCNGIGEEGEEMGGGEMSLHRCDASEPISRQNLVLVDQIVRQQEEIVTLTAENKELRHTIEQLVSEAANTPELLKELSRYRKGVEISEYVSKGQITWNDDGTTHSEGIIAIPKEFIGQRVRVLVVKEGTE